MILDANKGFLRAGFDEDSGELRLYDSAGNSLTGEAGLALSKTDPTTGQTVIVGQDGNVLVKNSYVRKLLLVGDSLNARTGNAYNALGGFGVSVTSLVNNGNGTLTLGFAANHNIPAGQQVRFSSDDNINTGLRNRWFNFVSTSATSGVLSVPADAVDFKTLSAVVSGQANWTNYFRQFLPKNQPDCSHGIYPDRKL